MGSLRRCLIAVALLAMAAGCSGSRWAKEDPDYAAKYPRHTDNVAKMAKQAVDARHVAGKGGPYAGMSGADGPLALGGEAGWFHYPRSYSEWHVGVAGLGYEGSSSLTVGATAGARLQVPARVAPFVGVGVYGGKTPKIFEDRPNYIDDDADGQIDEADEIGSDVVLAMYPEMGVHFWLTPEWRLTGSTSYLVAVSDDLDGFWMWNLSLARLTEPGGPTSQLGLATAARDRGWEPGDGANVAEYDAMQVEIPVTVESAIEAAGGVGTSAAGE